MKLFDLSTLLIIICILPFCLINYLWMPKVLNSIVALNPSLGHLLEGGICCFLGIIEFLLFLSLLRFCANVIYGKGNKV